MENDTTTPATVDIPALTARLEALEAEKVAAEAKARQLLDEKKKLQASFSAEKVEASELLAKNLATVAEEVANLKAANAENAKKALEAERKAAFIEAGITGAALISALRLAPDYATETGVDVTKLVTDHDYLITAKPKITTPQPVAGSASIGGSVTSLSEAQARLAQTGNIAEYADFLAALTKSGGATRT